jgi:hypothetical protein
MLCRIVRRRPSRRGPGGHHAAIASVSPYGQDYLNEGVKNRAKRRRINEGVSRDVKKIKSLNFRAVRVEHNMWFWMLD